MALLYVHVDTDTIRLIGYWWSEEMIRYLLHVHAEPSIMCDIASKMISIGNFTLHPGPAVPAY
jgi:hypothetical protein